MYKIGNIYFIAAIAVIGKLDLLVFILASYTIANAAV